MHLLRAMCVGGGVIFKGEDKPKPNKNGRLWRQERERESEGGRSGNQISLNVLSFTVLTLESCKNILNNYTSKLNQHVKAKATLKMKNK